MATKAIIKVTEVQKDEGVTKDGANYTRWKVYDESGFYFSGFNDPEAVQGEWYEVTFNLSGDKKQFRNYTNFREIPPPAQEPTVLGDNWKRSNAPMKTREQLEAEKQASITDSVIKKITVDVLKTAYENNKQIETVIMDYLKIYKGLTKNENN